MSIIFWNSVELNFSESHRILILPSLHPPRFTPLIKVDIFMLDVFIIQYVFKKTKSAFYFQEPRYHFVHCFYSQFINSLCLFIHRIYYQYLLSIHSLDLWSVHCNFSQVLESYGLFGQKSQILGAKRGRGQMDFDQLFLAKWATFFVLFWLEDRGGVTW